MLTSTRRKGELSLIVISALVAAMAAVGASLTLPHSYRSTVTLRIGATATGGAANATSSDNQYTDRLLNTYRDLATKPATLTLLEGTLRRTVGPSAGHVNVTASIPANTELLQLSVSAPTAKEASSGAAVLASLVSDEVENWAMTSGTARSVVVRTVDRGRPPEGSAGPSKVMLLIAALLFGGITGGALARLRRRLDVHLHTPEEIAEASGLPLLGHLASTPSKPDARDQATLLRVGLRLVDPTPRPQSNQEPPREALSLLVTGDLRPAVTATALSLARVLAGTDRQVLLIDNGLEHPFLPDIADIPSVGGLSTAVGRRGRTDGLLLRTSTPGLTFLPAGPAPDEPMAVLSSEEYRKLISRLSTEFDVVVLAAPGLLETPGPTLAGQMVDCAVLVAVVDQVDRQTARLAGEHLLALPLHTLGVVTLGRASTANAASLPSRLSVMSHRSATGTNSVPSVLPGPETDSPGAVSASAEANHKVNVP